MQLLNALEIRPQNKRLIYVEAHVNGKPTKAMVNTSATHNFVSIEKAKRLEFYASKEGRWLKAISSVAKPLQGVACKVTIHNGTWEDKINFIVAPLDYFKVVLRINFL